MVINKDILLECINYLCNYNFSDVTDYKLYDDFLIATVISDNKMDYFISKKSVDITFDEYLTYIRSKKLNNIKKSHN